MLTPIFMYSYLIRLAKLLGDIFRRSRSFTAFDIYLPAYIIASSRWCLEMTDDTIDDVLEIYVWVPGYFSLSIFALFVFLFAAPFSGLVEMCIGGHPIYIYGAFDSVSPDADNYESDTHNSIRSQSTEAEFRVTLGG